MIYAFVGEAGTGKTHRLAKAATTFHARSVVREGQSVLGLTFMHGSRRRMELRLSKQIKGAFRYRVATLDSFAVELVRRFRRYCGLDNGEIRPQMEGVADTVGWRSENGVWRAGLPTVRQQAAALLARQPVRATVAAAFPLVIIDEIQDCDHDLVALIAELAETTLVACAGDDFQALSGTASPAMAWLETKAEKVVPLNKQWRTSNSTILQAAAALRGDVRVGLQTVEVIEPPAAAIAATEIQKRIIRSGWKGSAALISPARPSTSKFFRETLKSLRKDKKNNLYATPFRWEGSAEEQIANDVEKACEPFAGQADVSAADLRKALDGVDEGTYEASLYRIVMKRLRLTGEEGLSLTHLAERARIRSHARRVYRWKGEEAGRRALTVHGAKNREFDYAFVLWPYEAFGDDEGRRRLLYNAITRARKNALVLVQKGKGGRVASDAALRLLVPENGEGS